MTEEVNNTLTFNDKEYSLEDISDKGKYIISQIQELRKEGEDLKRQLDRIDVASQAFTSLLGDELEKPPEEEFVAE